MITVSRITRTCSACPSQWEGVTDTGAEVYARYRHGYLYVEINDNRVWEGGIGGSFDGVMDYEELKAATSDTLEWPTEETPYEMKSPL